MLNIVLHTPKIPQNTGSLARLTAGNKLMLHLIEPLGFELSDKYLKRAGLDYWPYVNLKIHKSWEDFLSTEKLDPDRLFILSTKGEKSLYEIKFQVDDYLLFGDEESGLPESFHLSYPEKRFRIPMSQPAVRSLNLANSVAISTYEALRQIEYQKATGSL